MKVRYSIDNDHNPGTTEYYYELPTVPTEHNLPVNLDEEVELKEAKNGLWVNDWCRQLIPTDDGVRGDSFEDDMDWYCEHIAKMSLEELYALDRKVWEAMRVAGIRK